MTKYSNDSNLLMWVMVLVLTGFMLGCGGGDDGGGGVGGVGGVGGAGVGPAPVTMGTAGNFVILTKSGITNVPTSNITGNIGSSPINAAAIDVTCAEMTGLIYGVDATYVGSGDVTCFRGTAPDKTLVDNAVLDMGTAYNDAAGRTNPAPVTELGAGDISGRTITPGLYKWGTGVLISTNVTLSGGPNDVWIFQIAQGLTLANTATVTLTGGALARNVFWQSFGVVSIGTGAHFEGIVLAKTAINLTTGASVLGRLLAQTDVTLQSNAITQP